MRLALGLLLLGGVITSAADGHVHMLIPSKPSAKKGEEVTLTLMFGHPFEHELHDMAAPEALYVMAPDDKGMINVTKKLEKIQLPGAKGKKVTGYRLKYTPQVRGAHVFILRSSRVFLEEDKETVQDTVSVVLHVQAQKGWDHDGGGDGTNLGWRPLTRPYGLRPGMAFSAEVRTAKKGWTGQHALVEIERYNPAPPAKLPPDEEITWTAKTDRNGKVTATLPEAGWWGVTVTAEKDRVTRGPKGNKAQPPDPARPRATIWVHVSPKPADK